MRSAADGNADALWATSRSPPSTAASGVAHPPRGHHIIDARANEAAHERLTITVAGPTLARADAYATAAFAMGLEGLRWIGALPGYAAASITHDDRLISTRGLERYRA